MGLVVQLMSLLWASPLLNMRNIDYKTCPVVTVEGVSW